MQPRRQAAVNKQHFAKGASIAAARRRRRRTAGLLTPLPLLLLLRRCGRLLGAALLVGRRRRGRDSVDRERASLPLAPRDLVRRRPLAPRAVAREPMSGGIDDECAPPSKGALLCHACATTIVWQVQGIESRFSIEPQSYGHHSRARPRRSIARSGEPKARGRDAATHTQCTSAASAPRSAAVQEDASSSDI